MACNVIAFLFFYHSCNIILYVINKFRPLQHTYPPAECGKKGKSASNKRPSLWWEHYITLTLDSQFSVYHIYKPLKRKDGGRGGGIARAYACMGRTYQKWQYTSKHTAFPLYISSKLTDVETQVKINDVSFILNPL